MSLPAPLIYFFVLSHLYASFTYGASSGLLSYCNIGPSYHYGVGSTVMPWVQAPQNSTFYSLRTNDYGIATSTISVGSDVSFYTPGLLTKLHLRTLDLAKKFIGLVLYATKFGAGPQGNKVGQWSVSFGSPYFQAPSTCSGFAVTHSSAELKPIHNVFYVNFTKGTGTVEFWLMIKQGEQNRGFFYLPIVKPVLTEGPPSPPSSTPTTIISKAPVRVVVGRYGSSCTDACGTLPSSPYCDPVSTASMINDTASISALVSPLFPCPTLTFSACDAASPLIGPNNVCSFKSTTCPLSAVTLSAPPAPAPVSVSVSVSAPVTTCDASHADVQRICVCSTTQTALTTSPPTATSTVTTAPAPASVSTSTAMPTSVSTSTTAPASVFTTTAPTTLTATASASTSTFPSALHSSSTGTNRVPVNSAHTVTSSTVHVCALLLTTIGTLLNRPRPLLLLSSSILLLVLGLDFEVVSVSAHNWMYSPSRMKPETASTFLPCPVRLSPEPHVQVVKGQSFQMDWSVGHGDHNNGPVFFYFIAVAESDYHFLYNLTTSMMDEYLANAPPQSLVNGSLWQKRHWHWGGYTGQPLAAPDNQFFTNNSALSSSDPLYLPRDPVLQKRLAYHGGLAFEYAFLPNWLQHDKRASYTFAKYPWMISVDLFENLLVPHTSFSRSGDFANFVINPTKGPGNYIYHMVWGGYRDCVDINVAAGTTPVPLPYGIDPANYIPVPHFVKQDHCEFIQNLNPTTPCSLHSAVSLTSSSSSSSSFINASTCLASCAAAGANCNGVQITRAKNPEGTLPFPENIPWLEFTGNSSSENPERSSPLRPCDFWSVYNRTTYGCTSASLMCPLSSLKPSAGDYVCWGTVTFLDPLLQTTLPWAISNDPVEPAFYSTCWIKVMTGAFPVVVLPAPIPIPFVEADSCIDCAFRLRLQNAANEMAPNWTQAVLPSNSNCYDCDGQTY